MHAGIAGMGIMGRLLALALHEAGWQITLFDQHSGETNCSLAAAGLLTPFSELDKAALIISHLGQDALKTAWPKVMKHLPASEDFQQLGTLVLSHPRDHAEWQQFSRRIASQLDSVQPDYQQLSNDGLMQLEPELGKFETAYYFPEEGHVNCEALMSALKLHLEMAGIQCLTHTPVISLEPGLIVTHTERHSFDVVFDCRGLGAQAVYPDLRPLRGELIWLHAPEVQLQRPIRFLHPRYSLYIVPRPGQVYLVGASEIEADDAGPISVRTTLELLTAAYYMHAGFAEARILKTVTHCRPTLSTHLPRIKFTEGLIAVNGLYRHGYLIAPTLAEEILRGLNAHPLKYPSLWEHQHDQCLFQ
jgi:glycine oxidase